MTTAVVAAGLRVTRVEITISGITNHLNYCYFYNICIYIIHECGRGPRVKHLWFINLRFQCPTAETIKHALLGSDAVQFTRNKTTLYTLLLPASSEETEGCLCRQGTYSSMEGCLYEVG